MNKDAWDILLKDEKMSITLSLGHNKSSWESGEILGRAHYKYLEINARAEKFLRMFTDYMDMYGDIPPTPNHMSENFKDYIRLLLKERKQMKEAIAIIGNKTYKKGKAREEELEEAMYELKHSELHSERDLYDLIIEFDRWNNFRILPRKLQQPSAFKRRNKSRELKHLKNICDMPSYSIKKIRETYAIERPHAKGYYLPIMSTNISGLVIILKVSQGKRVVNELSQLGLFLFLTNDDAIEFSNLVTRYLYPKRKSDNSPVIRGLSFWTPYRKLIKKSVNYDKAYNLIFNRKFMEDALLGLGLRKHRIKR